MRTDRQTELQKYFTKLLETLKDCLQPKDKNPDNRPDCSQLLERINELTIDKTILTENNNILEFKRVLEKQEQQFLLRFFNYKLQQIDSYL